MINRIVQPDLKTIEKVSINNFKTFYLDNTVPVYVADGVEEDLLRIEMRFPAGRWYEASAGQSHAVSALMKKGTKGKTALQIAEAVEFYGAQLDTSSGNDTTSLSLYCLGKHLPHVLPIVAEILNDAVFPDDEIVLYKERKKQRFLINSQNTDFHAGRMFSEVLFGKQHPYGYSLQLSDIDELERSQVQKFYNEHYSIGNTKIFVSGNVKEEVIGMLNAEFGKYEKKKIPIAASDKSLHAGKEKEYYHELSQSVQSSVRIGCISIPKDHPDYPEVNVLNTVFGGYFGSRLMSNIREDKGFTYGIHSYIAHLDHASYFSIDMETGNEVCKAAIAEVYKEMDLLRKMLIREDELTTVKNYMLGSLLRATDGPFNRINVIRNIVLSGLDFSYFQDLVKGIQTITPERLRDLANIYLIPENMREVICGNLSAVSIMEK
ncbi:MAG: M16 family metallopeptidase [Chitinophagales bacterium]